MGFDAVEAYHRGETSTLALRKLGFVNHYAFDSLKEVNAFIYGVEQAEGNVSMLLTEDLND